MEENQKCRKAVMKAIKVNRGVLKAVEKVSKELLRRWIRQRK